ncbi:hypothetical protein [uncultured Flavobacterium sp.]|uniref:hypothetical protein n=1 Tax=uncultured Flavobacterium sp. TaxID=165435 RepID=UPI0025F067BF|nr:hypothetical protein [uncultured Flavobacterium sp.]
MNSIEFPAIDLTSGLWTEENIIEVVYYNHFFYSSSESDFLEFANNHLVVDVSGRVFKVVGKDNLGSWREYVPIIAKSRLIFESQNTVMDLDEIKQFMLERVKELPDFYFLIEHIEKSSTIRELIKGM